MSESLASDVKKPLIVFVHGILGFDAISLPGLSLHYYRKLGKHLSSFEFPILFPKLPSVGTIADRAKHLADLLAPYKENSIYIIAHSMGGLDSRYFIHYHDQAKRVRALATVGTPHRGTPLASWFVQDSSLFARIGRYISRPALFDLTPKACNRFNELVPNRPDVRYLSYAGCRPVSEIPLPVRPWARHVQKEEGDNDGQVPVKSAAWGDFQGVVRADHFELVGWSFTLPSRKNGRPFDHFSFYEKMVREVLDV